jgi:ATP-dependent helicase/nuclease subunit A
VRWLRQLYEANVQVPRPPREAGNAVSLTTSHSAKRLEWPVAVVPDLARESPTEFYPILLDPMLGVALNFGEDGGSMYSTT